jgi:hypothetical protein
VNSSIETATLPAAIKIETTLRDAKSDAEEARRLAASGRVQAATRAVETALEKMQSIAGAASELPEEAAMIRVLASVGTQLAAFVHEINGLLGIAKPSSARKSHRKRKARKPCFNQDRRSDR